jgi:hypothetical protein
MYYGMDFCPGFWEWLDSAHSAGTVASVERIGDELRTRDDDVATWASARPPSFFVPAGPGSIEALGTVSEWVQSGARYRPAAITEFLGSADLYLIAQALEGRHVVVTRETPSNAVRRVKIPEPCLGVGVRQITPFQMLRETRARFTLAR